MWKALVKSKNEPAYYMKVEENDKKIEKTSASLNWLSYKISVTNYVKLWSGEFDNDGIIKIMLESNKGTEAQRSDGQGFLKAAMRMLNNPKTIDKIEFNELNTGHLNVNMLRLGEIVVKMNFSLSVCCAEQFFDSVTRPLLLIIDDQNKSETELRKLMKGISEYLSKIPKELLMRYEKKEINHYNDKMHMQNHSVMEDLFGKDEEERIDPRHILYGRPLPALPYNMPLPIKDEGNMTAASTLLPIGAIKTETTDEKPGSSVSNIGTSVSKLDTNVSNLDNLSSVGPSVSNANNHPPTVTINNASDAHLKQELIKKEEPEPVSTGQENNENVQIVQPTTRRRSTETQSSQIPRNNTPKKRRKNIF